MQQSTHTRVAQPPSAVFRIWQIEIDSQIDQIDLAVDHAFTRAGFQLPNYQLTQLPNQGNRG